MNPTDQHPIDEAIDQVLAALRDATVPHNMERRILNVLDAEASKSVIPSEAQRSRGILAFRNTDATAISSLLRWKAIGGVTVVLVAIALTLTVRRHTAPKTTTNSVPTTIHPLQPPSAAITTTQPAPRLHISRPQQPTLPPSIKIAQADDKQQISHPAPPIPLTDQERVLLRYTRRGHTDDLAQIANDRKAAEDQHDAADFQAFFTPPEIPLGESE